MRFHKYSDSLIVAVGQALCVAAMIGIFALVGQFKLTVLWGGLAGGFIATANFFLMTLYINKAADRAEAQDVAGGQKLIHLSYMGRMIGMFVALIVCAKSGLCHPLALIIPLAFTRPILTVSELLRKKGGTNP
jgi:hypothetical protein